MAVGDIDAFLAVMKRADVVRALSRARSAAEVAVITRRFDLPGPEVGEGGTVADRVLQ
jgi:hypothetical protein